MTKIRITNEGKRIFEENNLYERYSKDIRLLDELSKKKVFDTKDINLLCLLNNDILRITEVIKYKVINDKYNEDYDTKLDKIIYKISGKKINKKLNNHRAQLRYYYNLIDELKQITNNHYSRSVDDIKDAINLAFTAYIAFNNQMKKDDYNMLNKNHYKDSDIKEYDIIKNDVDELYGTLKYKNMLYIHNIKTK